MTKESLIRIRGEIPSSQALEDGPLQHLRQQLHSSRSQLEART